MTRHRQMAGSLMPICGNRMARAMRFLCFPRLMVSKRMFRQSGAVSGMFLFSFMVCIIVKLACTYFTLGQNVVSSHL